MVDKKVPKVKVIVLPCPKSSEGAVGKNSAQLRRALVSHRSSPFRAVLSSAEQHPQNYFPYPSAEAVKEDPLVSARSGEVPISQGATRPHQKLDLTDLQMSASTKLDQLPPNETTSHKAEQSIFLNLRESSSELQSENDSQNSDTKSNSEAEPNSDTIRNSDAMSMTRPESKTKPLKLLSRSQPNGQLLNPTYLETSALKKNFEAADENPVGGGDNSRELVPSTLLPPLDKINLATTTADRSDLIPGAQLWSDLATPPAASHQHQEHPPTSSYQFQPPALEPDHGPQGHSSESEDHLDYIDLLKALLSGLRPKHPSRGSSSSTRRRWLAI